MDYTYIHILSNEDFCLGSTFKGIMPLLGEGLTKMIITGC